MIRSLFVFCFMMAFSLLMVFIGLNVILGCESWDNSYWTDYNSCITPLQILGLE